MIVQVALVVVCLLSAVESIAQPRQALRFEQISIEQGLSQLSAQSIAQDKKGFMWFGTQDGLNRFDGYSFTIYRHDPDDAGSPSDNNVLALLSASDGMLWVGTLRGGLSRFMLFNREIGAGEPGSPLTGPIGDTEEIVLSHRQYLFSIDFAALDAAQPEKVMYAYKLEGMDKEWVHTDARNRRVTYAKLPAGDDTLRIEAANHDGCWAGQARSLRIRAQPPPWKTWWAYTLYCAVSVSIIWSLGHARYLRLRARAAVNIERIRIANDLHDSLAQDLTGMMMHIEFAEMRAAESQEAALEERPGRRSSCIIQPRWSLELQGSRGGLASHQG